MRYLIVLLTSLLFAVPAHAAAPPTIVGPSLLPGDATLATSAGNDESPTLCPGGGMVLAVWADSRTNLFQPPPFPEEQGARDIYAARLDPLGNLIDTVPIAVEQDFGYQTKPRAAWNGENWLVVWESQEPTQFYYASAVQAARVAPDGTVLDAQPITIVSYANASGAFYDVTSNGSEWLVVAEGMSSGENDLVGVRVAADGSIVNPTPTVLVPAAYYLFFSVSVHFAGGEYLLVYDNLSNYSARRFTPSLAPAGSFVVPGLVTESNGSGYYVAWGSAGTYVGSPMTKEGVRAFPSGVPIASTSEGTGIGVAWDGTRWWLALASYAQGLTLRRITAGGSLLDAFGIPVEPQSALHVGSFDVAGAPGGGGLVAWDDDRAGGQSPKDVRGGFVSAAGVGAARGPVSLAAPAQLRADFAPGPDGFLVAFRSQVSGSHRILAQRVTPQGIALDAEPILVANGATFGNPAAAWNGSLFLVSWSDGSKIYAKRLSPDGTVLDPSPIQVMTGFSPDVSAVGDVFLIVGIHFWNNNPEFQVPIAKRLAGTTGALLDAVPDTLGISFARNPRVIACDGRWLAVWQRHSSHDNPPASLRAAFVEADGSNHSEIGSITAGFTPAPAFNGSHLLIAYRTGTDGVATKDVRGLRMLPDGSLPDGPSGFVISSAPDEQTNPAVAWDGTQFVIAWDDKRNAVRFFDERTDLYGARVSAAGVLLDPAGFAIAAGTLPEELPAIAGAGQGAALVASSLFRTGDPFSSYRIGTFLVGESLVGVPGGAETPDPGIAWICPNPFSPGAVMTYVLGAPARVTLQIYDAAGRRVAACVDGLVQPVGEHRVAWDGSGARGVRAASGIYFARLEAGPYTETRRLVLVR